MAGGFKSFLAFWLGGAGYTVPIPAPDVFIYGVIPDLKISGIIEDVRKDGIVDDVIEIGTR